MTREYQIKLTDGNRTGTATLRIDGQCMEWLHRQAIYHMLLPIVPPQCDYEVLRVFTPVRDSDDNAREGRSEG